MAGGRCARRVQALAQQIDVKQPRPQITVPHTTGESLARVIDYLYTDEVAFTPDNVVEVYAAAGALNLTRLQQLATVYIRDNVTVDNVLPMLQAANRLKAADVEKFLFKFFQNKERYGDRRGSPSLAARRPAGSLTCGCCSLGCWRRPQVQRRHSPARDQRDRHGQQAYVR